MWGENWKKKNSGPGPHTQSYTITRALFCLFIQDLRCISARQDMEVVITGTVLANKELNIQAFVWLLLWGNKQKDELCGFLFKIFNQIL